MRQLAIPDAAAMLELHPAEVRALVEGGQLEGVRVRGRWLISSESVERLGSARREDAEADPLEADVRRLEARVAELERRLDAVESAYLASGRKGDLGPGL